MKAITVRQPWATLIAESIKDIENRPQRWSPIQTIAIHAGQAVDWDALDDPRVIRAAGGATRQQALIGPRFTRGHILATASITSCHEAGPGCCTSTWGNPKGYHLVIDNVRRLKHPVYATGRLGLWTLPIGEEIAVLREIGAAA